MDFQNKAARILLDQIRCVDKARQGKEMDRIDEAAWHGVLVEMLAWVGGVAVCGLKTTKIAPSKERCSGLFSLSGLEIPNDAHLKFDTHR